MMNELEYWNKVEGIGTLYVEIELLVGIEPVLFVCVLEEKLSEKYLVMTYNSSKTTYIMRKITDSELLDMLDKKVTMEETFRHGDEIFVTYMNQEDISIKKYNPMEFDEKMLPRKGATYNIRSQYILDYKKELRIPKFKLNYQDYEYQIGLLYKNVEILDTSKSMVSKMLYDYYLYEQSNCCECVEVKIA